MESITDRLERIEDFYNRAVESRIKQINEGNLHINQTTLRNLREREFEILEADEHHKSDVKAVLDLRGQVLAGIMYDKLQAVQSAGSGTLDSVFSAVRDPLLEDARIWLDRHGGLKGVDREQFVEGYGATIVGEKSRPYMYLRPLSFLEIVAKNPFVVSRLEGLSTYFPHRLIKPEVKTQTTRDLEMEVAQVLPAIFSERMVDLMGKINNFVGPQQSRSSGEAWLGKYGIHRERFQWVTQGGDAEQALDELFSNHAVKREIYETLAEFTILTGTVARNANRNPKNVGHQSSLFLTGAEYARIKDCIKDYARNQILWAWKNSDGTAVPETTLSKFAGLSAKSENGQLQIYDSYTRGKYILTRESRYTNTIKFLPYFVAILSRAYQQAQDVKNRRG